MTTKSNKGVWCWIFCEVLLIVLVFFLHSGGIPPDRNETHYLAKAKHYWNPEWCHNDLFLQSSDAHLVFNWTFGWITRYVSLPAAAWIGRFQIWCLFALAWQRLSNVLVPRPLFSVLSAAIFVVVLDRSHLAGEWVIGGVEAKGFAYTFLVAGLWALVSERWRLLWVFLGMAAAFHILVGGWAMIAALGAWVCCGRHTAPFLSLIRPLSLAAGCALCGLLPALSLNGGTDEAVTRAANRIYVFGRLDHHLLFHQFDWTFILRHTLAWLVLGLCYRSLKSDPAQQRLRRFATGAFAIACCGALIDQTIIAAAWLTGSFSQYMADLQASLLRFYWFRLSDATLPLALSLALGGLLLKYGLRYPSRSQWGLVVLILTTLAGLTETYLRRHQDMRPAAELQMRPVSDGNTQNAHRRYHDWVRTCQWIGSNTPQDAIFLTPRHQQTFRWFANRAEAVNWKDVPQNAPALLEWWQRIQTLHTPHANRHGLAGHDFRTLTAACRRYSISYIVLDRSLSKQRLRLPRVYPRLAQEKAMFEVYQIPYQQNNTPLHPRHFPLVD